VLYIVVTAPPLALAFGGYASCSHTCRIFSSSLPICDGCKIVQLLLARYQHCTVANGLTSVLFNNRTVRKSQIQGHHVYRDFWQCAFVYGQCRDFASQP